ncbi:uncharacterized protein LOC112196334 [Rosa chinensis]|uniref:uncharacterized protein LOC112196334 n=1 Tax=Rosa chinensis TaxID=74649 RepID=UPI001AD93C4A|nr:uncharacterized protein LOC112196334 [Rosa chinensis]
MELNQGILYNIYEAKKNHLKCGTKGQPLIIDFTVAHWSSLLYDSVVNFLSSSPLGPLDFNFTEYDGASFHTASILFIDAPVATGFYYATDAKEYATSDTKTASQVYGFFKMVMMPEHHHTSISSRIKSCQSEISNEQFAKAFNPSLHLHVNMIISDFH